MPAGFKPFTLVDNVYIPENAACRSTKAHRTSSILSRRSGPHDDVVSTDEVPHPAVRIHPDINISIDKTNPEFNTYV